MSTAETIDDDLNQFRPSSVSRMESPGPRAGKMPPFLSAPHSHDVK